MFLTPAVIDATLESIAQDPADVVLHYVEKSAFEQAGLPARRTFIPIAGKHYTGGTIYFVRKFSKVFAALPSLGQLRKHRKDPERLLRLIGCRGDADLAEIQQALSERFAVRTRICISPHAELGLNQAKAASEDGHIHGGSAARSSIGAAWAGRGGRNGLALLHS